MTRPDPGGVTGNPLLREDWRIGAGSPAIGAGAVIGDNGGKDYFGNPLPEAAPNPGAYEGPGLP